jgi:hypothetical protein
VRVRDEHVVRLDVMTWMALHAARGAGDRASHPRPRARLQGLDAPALFRTPARGRDDGQPLFGGVELPIKIPGRPHEVRRRRRESEHARIIAASRLRIGYEYFICSLHRTGPRASNGSDAMPYTAACSDYTLHVRASRRNVPGAVSRLVRQLRPQEHSRMSTRVRSCSSSRETRTSAASS